MKKNKILYLILGIILLIIIICSIILIKNHKKELTCKNQESFITMRFAKNIATKAIFMEDGKIVEKGSGSEFFDNPTSKRLLDFLHKVKH